MALSNLTDLEASWAEWMSDKSTTGKPTQGANWRKDSPGEWAKLKAYRNGTGPRPSLATNTGKQMVFETDAWLKAKSSSPSVVYPSPFRYPSEVI